MIIDHAEIILKAIFPERCKLLLFEDTDCEEPAEAFAWQVTWHGLTLIATFDNEELILITEEDEIRLNLCNPDAKHEVCKVMMKLWDAM